MLNVIDTINSMANPFDLEQENLVHIVSGVVAPDAVKHDLLEAKAIGNNKFTSFFQEQVINEKPDLFKSIKKTNLKTFAFALKSVNTTTAKGKEISLKSSRNLFARLLLLAKSREVDLREVLSYSLGPYPLSLATVDGNLTKTAKATFMHMIEEMITTPCDVLPSQCAIVVDAMALLQCLSRIPPRFGDLSSLVLSKLVSLAKYHEATRVDFVADRYKEYSIKSTERSKRAAKGSIAVSIYGGNQPIPTKWKKFLSNGENKESLIRFIVDAWKNVKSSDLPNLTLYATRDDKCLKFHASSESSSNVETTIVPELKSDHEEADTRLLLHAKHASENGYRAVAIKSPDTDVFVMMAAMQSRITGDLFFLTGTQNKQRILPIRDLSSNMPSGISDSLIGFHAFTGKYATYSNLNGDILRTITRIFSGSHFHYF